MRACRDKALATISADGILLVLASMIENMPYVLAEASVLRIPLLIYDVGGVTEMIDPKEHADIICGTPKALPPTPQVVEEILRDAILALVPLLVSSSPAPSWGTECHAPCLCHLQCCNSASRITTSWKQGDWSFHA